MPDLAARSADAGLALRLLGSPRLELHGSPIKVDTRKAIALMAFLALEGGEHRRERLAAIFWPESNSARARGALRRTLSALKGAGVSPWLDLERQVVALAPAQQLRVDAQEFSARVEASQRHRHPSSAGCSPCQSRLAAAVEIHRGEFMEGFTLADSPEFDDWQLLQRERLRRQLAWCLERLAGGHSRAGNLEQAIEYAGRWLAQDPLHEPAHRQLMQLYAQSGDRGMALRQYLACVRVLQEELGVPPLEETTAAYEAIKAGEPILAEPARGRVELAAPERPASAPPLSFVGRGRELEIIERLARGANGEISLVALFGETGIGKTRMAEMVRQRASDRSAPALMTRCFQGEQQLAYSPLIELLRSAVNSAPLAALRSIEAIWLSEVARLLPELHESLPELPDPAPLASPAGKNRFLEGISQTLRALLAGGVLIVDDLHWADEASLECLAYLARRSERSERSEDQPLLIVVTWLAAGPDELVQLRGWLRTLPSGSGREIGLQRLSRDELSQLVGETLGSQSERPPELAERLYLESEGLPLLLAEYLAALQEQPSPEGPTGWPLPGALRQATQARLSALSGASAQLVGAAAVIGRSFDFETLRLTSGRGEEETIAGLEALLSAGLIRELAAQGGGSSPRYDFSHDKIRQLVLEGTSQARIRLLHRRAAEALMAQVSRAAPGELAGAIASHLSSAGQPAAAAEYYRQAAEHAMALYANAEALDHLQAALALDHPDKAGLFESIGDLETLRGNYDAAGQHYEAAAAFAEEAAHARLEHKQGLLFQRWGRWEQAASHFRASLLGLPEADHAQRARLLADWSLLAHRQGKSEAAIDHIQQAIQLAQAAQEARALAQAHNISGVLARRAGDLDQAREHLERSLEYAEGLGSPEARLAALNNLALVLADKGELPGAREAMQQALKLCESVGDRHRQAALYSNLADIHHAAGQEDQAIALLKRSAELFAEIGNANHLPEPEIWKLLEW